MEATVPGYFLILSVLFVCVPAAPEDIKDLNPIELLKLGQDVSQLLPREPQHSDVEFYLKIKNVTEPVLLTSYSSKSLVDVSKKSKVLIHGWLENHKRSWYKGIADQYLEIGDFNVIEVDWETLGRMPYIYSAKNVEIIGHWVAQFIEETNLAPNNVHVIGHSLGAHIAGFAGKKIFADTGIKFERITALDPAGPYFRLASVNPSDRLNKEDASVVDVLHTDAGFYGYENPTGTLDIYVNGGQRIQPGCLDDDNAAQSFGAIVESSFCSHARSTKYFIEWIHKGRFKCSFCRPVLGINFYADRCTFHHTDRMLAAEDVNAQLTGVCFAKTNKQEPYLM